MVWLRRPWVAQFLFCRGLVRPLPASLRQKRPAETARRLYFLKGCGPEPAPFSIKRTLQAVLGELFVVPAACLLPAGAEHTGFMRFADRPVRMRAETSDPVAHRFDQIKDGERHVTTPKYEWFN